MGAVEYSTSGETYIGESFTLSYTITTFVALASITQDNTTRSTCSSEFCSSSSVNNVTFTPSASGITVEFNPVSRSHMGIWECTNSYGDMSSYMFTPQTRQNDHGGLSTLKDPGVSSSHKRSKTPIWIYALPVFTGLLILLMFSSVTMYYKFYRRKGETESCCCVETTDDDYWNATRVNTANFNPRWMERLSDNLSVANLSIPGTHDTMARTTRLQCAWCQSMSLPNQMKTGIRYLDIRCRRYCGKLYVYHGPCFQNCELSDCFREMIDFLQENTSECLLVRVKQESECPINCTSQSFSDLFVESLGTSNLFWLEEHVPRLGSVRGMIVILREFELDPYSQALGIPYGNSNCIDIEDNYDQWSYQARHTSTIRHLTEAALELGTNHILYLTHSSAVICKGLVPPRETARRLNPMLYNYIRERQEHLGIIAMDYPGPGLIRNIIDKNS